MVHSGTIQQRFSWTTAYVNFFRFLYVEAISLVQKAHSLICNDFSALHKNLILRHMQFPMKTTGINSSGFYTEHSVVTNFRRLFEARFLIALPTFSWHYNPFHTWMWRTSFSKITLKVPFDCSSLFFNRIFLMVFSSIYAYWFPGRLLFIVWVKVVKNAMLSSARKVLEFYASTCLQNSALLLCRQVLNCRYRNFTLELNILILK